MYDSGNPERLQINVFTKDKKEMQKYFNLFVVLLSDKCEEIRDSASEKRIITDKAMITFTTAIQASRGRKCHFILNLTQDEEFHYCVAMPTAIMNSFLDKEGKWKELFNRM